MAATVIINEKNGAGGTKTDKTSQTIRFKNADNATVDLANPMTIPGADQEYSFQKYLLAQITAMGGAQQLTDLVAYTDGTNGLGTGRKVWYAAPVAYATPVVPNEAQDPPQYSATPMTDLFLRTSGSPLALGAGPFTTTGDIGNHLVLVAEVEPTATSGVSTAETLTFAWNEI